MRLNELFQLDELNPIPSDVKKFKKSPTAVSSKQIHKSDNWHEEVDAFVTQYDFHPLGKGEFASVYGNTKYPFVVKLFATGDTAYKTWLSWCRTHQHNRFVPKIRGNVIKISDSLLAVRLEQLSPIRGEAYHKYSHLKDIFQMWNRLSDPNYMEYFDRIERTYPDFMKDRDIIEIAEFLEAHREGPIQMDLHDENMMRRGDQIVVTDPLYVVGYDSMS